MEPVQLKVAMRSKQAEEDILDQWCRLQPNTQVALLPLLIRITRRQKSHSIAWLTVELFEDYFGSPSVPIHLRRTPDDYK